MDLRSHRIRAGCLGAVLLLGGCGERAEFEPEDRALDEEAVATAPAGRELFVERAEALGLDFVHSNGMTGELYFAEMTGAGAAFFDPDGDGDLDAYLVQGHRLEPGGAPVDDSARDRLYRNEWVETGELRFTDVTAESGLVSAGYGMGVAVGDYDADGDPDLYVTNFGPNQMFENRGEGPDGFVTFRDVTERTGTGDARWSTSASFLDYDRDGHLDLYVANYVDFTLATHKECYAQSSARDYCGPLSYRPYPDRLFRNLGDGRFEDASERARIVTEFGGALGVIGADFNADGWLDIYVANDGLENQLWVHEGQQAGAVSFRDEALIAGCACNEDGKAEGSMGVDAADYDGDGDDDLFMTHIADETHTLYVNDGRGIFEDHTLESRLALATRPFTGFGTAFFDYDNDGWLDLLIANGAVKAVEALARAGDPYPLHEPNQLFRNRGDGRFEEVTAIAGAVFELSEVSRGAAFGDVDNDGDVDVLIHNNNGRARLLINTLNPTSGWIGLRLVGPAGSDAYGARVRAETDDGRVLHRRVRADGSYCSANDPRILLGLGAAEVESLSVQWPDGTRETLDASRWAVGRYSTVKAP